MERRATQHLATWADTPKRRPMIVRGARQVGKTWLVRDFAARRFPGRLHSIDLERRRDLHPIFAGDLDPGRILSALEPMLTAPHDTWIRYLGLLFAGAACERSGRVADAAAHYRTSRKILPEAQTGAVALSFLLRQQGESGTAREALSPLMSPVMEQGQDPWWDYYYGQWRLVPVALLAMRHEVAR